MDTRFTFVMLSSCSCRIRLVLVSILLARGLFGSFSFDLNTGERDSNTHEG